MQIDTMTIPLWGLLAFIVWSMFIVVLLTAARFRHLNAGGSILDFGDPTGNKLPWRIFRAQANCAENLPLYAGTVLLLEVRGVANSIVDSLAVTYIAFRILHSLIHIFGFNPNFRFACLCVQYACLIVLMIYGVM